jgi:hypothetical protein
MGFIDWNQIEMKSGYNKFKVGDVFSVQLPDRTWKYFQYIANDSSQLNSDVIRAFKKAYSTPESSMQRIIRDEIAFYGHTILGAGVKMLCWSKVGNEAEIGRLDILFRNSNDYGNPEVKISNDWYVWRINEPYIKVGRLLGENQLAEIGIVMSPLSVFDRMCQGKYVGVYPGF